MYNPGIADSYIICVKNYIYINTSRSNKQVYKLYIASAKRLFFNIVMPDKVTCHIIHTY